MMLAVLLVAALSACSGGKPEDTLEAFYRAAEKGDVEKATKQVSLANVKDAQLTQAKGKVQMIVGEVQGKLKANGGFDSLEVVESKVDPDGKTADLRVKLKFGNGTDKQERARLVKESDGWKIVIR
jgi:phage shock protein A